MRLIRETLLVMLVLLGSAAHALAIPVLQLDIAGGVYDPVTQTIVASSDPFVLTAILTPQTGASQAQINALLADTYYISASLSPQIGPTSTNLGSFSVDGTTYSATSGMTYGVPPLETIPGLVGHDPGDLAQHGIFPTFFIDQAFQFSAMSKTLAYNTQTSPGGLTPNAAGTAYYFNFTVDSRLLDPAYVLHFDLYNSSVVQCRMRGNCVAGDIDVNAFAPFSHDAQGGTKQVPEPATWSFMMIGMASAVLASRKRRALKK